jgi:hypothetical protein
MQAFFNLCTLLIELIGAVVNARDKRLERFKHGCVSEGWHDAGGYGHVFFNPTSLQKLVFLTLDEKNKRVNRQLRVLQSDRTWLFRHPDA